MGRNKIVRGSGTLSLILIDNWLHINSPLWAVIEEIQFSWSCNSYKPLRNAHGRKWSKERTWSKALTVFVDYFAETLSRSCFAVLSASE